MRVFGPIASTRADTEIGPYKLPPGFSLFSYDNQLVGINVINISHAMIQHLFSAK